MKKKSIKKSKMNILYIVLGIIFVLLIAWIIIGYFSSQVEHLKYKVIDSSKEYEIRELEEHLIIETEVTGGWDTGGREAFNILAGYIFGNNISKEKIAMTAPVVESKSEKIAMTAPVIAEPSNNDLMVYSFVLPAKYTLENLPKPTDSRVKIKKIDKKKIAVLRFSGFFNNAIYEKKKQELIKYLERDGLKYGKISSAGYNPPWTPPFTNRLEVWAELK